MDLTHQRCLNHKQREAAARCPECGHFYCRECVAEHEGRVVCANCLTTLAAKSGRKTTGKAWLALAVPWVAAFVFIWMCFFGLGRALLVLPDSFHSGEIWQGNLQELE